MYSVHYADIATDMTLTDNVYSKEKHAIGISIFTTAFKFVSK